MIVLYEIQDLFETKNFSKKKAELLILIRRNSQSFFLRNRFNCQFAQKFSEIETNHFRKFREFRLKKEIAKNCDDFNFPFNLFFNLKLGKT